MDTRPSSAADRAYDYVKDAIVRRTLTSDQLLAEGQIADAVGVSRTPVREALLRLEAQGLVRLLPKRGVLVVPVTAGEVEDVVETRRLIEVHALTQLMDAGVRPSLLAALSTHIEDMATCIAAADAEAYVRADRAFHTCFVRAAGNDILTDVYASLRDRQLRMGVVNLLAGDGEVDIARMQTTLGEHRAILRALEQGDAEAARAAVIGHIAVTERLLGQR